MSLILEALKKSERQRRLGESPSLGSPIMAVRRRRNLLPGLVVLIAIGLGALWWMQRGSNPPAADPAAVTAETPTAAKPPAAAVNPAPRSPVPVNQSIPAAPMQTRQASENRREKLRSGELVAADPQAGAAATIKESEPVSAADPAALAAAMANAPVPAPPPDNGQARAVRPPPIAKTPVTAAQSVAVPPTKPAPAMPAPAAAAEVPADSMKLMWELPLAMRSKLPELKLSMHVFAADPAQRFVIINGERSAEGDEVEGMKLIEIRKDGVVFDYEGERFLYPRGGR